MNSRLNFMVAIIALLLSVICCKTANAQAELSFDIFTQENGLPNNRIHCIFQDSKGWMWFGSSQGLSRFDGYNFINFVPSASDSTSLKGALVRVIKEDRHGNLLVGTETGGLNIFDRKTETFTQPYQNNPQLRDLEFSVNDIVKGHNGVLWLATDFNLLVMDSLGNFETLKPRERIGTSSLSEVFVSCLKLDNEGKLWIGTYNGLYKYSPSDNTLEAIELPYTNNPNREIWELYLDDNGLMWVGTYSHGLFTIDTKRMVIKNIELDNSIPRSETVRSISKGNYSEYWIGTRGGLFKYSTTNGVKGFYKHNLQDSRSLSSNSILSICHDTNGETWIGTRSGVNLLAKKKQIFHNFTVHPDNNNYLNSSPIYTLWQDKRGKIWAGSEDGGINIYNPKTGIYNYITMNGQPGESLSKNCIKAFIEDNEGNLWSGTYMGGIDVINLSSGKIFNYRHDANVPGSLIDNRIWSFCKDQNNEIWIATSRGVNRFDAATKTFIHYPQLTGYEQALWIQADSKGNLWIGGLDETIIFNLRTKKINRHFEHSRAMFEDSEKQIWIATNDKGLALYSINNGAVKYYDETKGLSNNQTLGILEDDARNIWISTSNGLSKFNPESEVFQNFTYKDGLGNNQFCYGAALKTPSGNFLFGTTSGFNLFNPNEIEDADNNTPLVFTDLKIFNKTAGINEGKKPILTQSITESDHITFNHKQNFITLEFAALNYVNSENNLYSYKLEGFNTDWTEPSKIRSATYTNLNPGNYTLRVKRILPGNIKANKELELALTILPPFWKTNWFLTLILLLILALVYMIIQFFINREKIKTQLVIERSNARKLHEVDMMKLKFFTNISHEIRTPLTLILGPLNKMLQANTADSNTMESLKLMQRNTHNLDRLISQLLDFRKLQSGNLKLNLTEADIVGFISNIVTSFKGYATDKNIKLTFNTLKKRLFTSFDPDKIEKIINNLLSNAFKYTEANGSISVYLSLIFDTEEEDFDSDADKKQFIEITIKDTGKGIPKKNLDRIFVRFFQSDEKDAQSGAGIGLSLVKDLVKLHQGNILVTSKVEKGTKFTIRIPYKMATENIENVSNSTENSKTNPAGISGNEEPTDPNEKIMLVVEDNTDVRQFVSSHFEAFYKVYQAINGEEGWKKTLELVPDIIISDIIMPETDGYDLCKRLKNDERTSHIPVILLTAMHSKEHQLKGLTKGADDYITKPFDLSVLQAKVDNILSIRESLKEKYTSTMVLEPTNVVLTSPDEKFLKRVVDVVEENIADSELDIENFALKVGISRMQLYRKLHALTDMTVKEFIRHIRLKRAIQLLDQQKLNISEVAYEVGFKDLSHFRKCFKKEFKMSASEYLSKKKLAE